MTPDRMRPAWGKLLLLLSLCVLAGCARPGGTPQEFPPARLGMAQAEVRAALAKAGANLIDDSPRVLRATGRDARVAEEVFLFYDGRLAAWTQRLEEAATRTSFARARGRYTRCFGRPIERGDNGLVLTARWRLPGQEGRVLLSAYVGDRSGRAQLMVRVEDPSVLRSLIRQMGRERAPAGSGAAEDSAGSPAAR
jgi:hypothetical protein